MKHWIAVGLVALVVSGCGSGAGNKEMLGTGVGAVGGGLIGSQFGGGKGKLVATGVGVVAGGLIGNSIGRQLDERDRLLAQRAHMQAMERGRSGQPVAWRNPDNGRHGSFVPGPAYVAQGASCRDYTHTIYVGGQPETMRGKACRNADGTWRNVG